MTDHLPDDLMRRHEEWLKDHPQLDLEEHKIVLEVVDAWRGWKALGRGLRVVVVLLGTLAATSLAWDQLVAKIKALMAP
jgi:hypothetical protein